jgi:hypothetical protein
MHAYTHTHTQNATQSHTNTAQGDNVEILIITKDGIKREELELKRD